MFDVRLFKSGAKGPKLFLRFGLLPLMIGLLAGWFLPVAATGPAKPVRILTIDSSINPAVADYLVRHIEKAEKEQAPAVVIQLDTPGGLDSSMRAIVQALLNAKVPVIVYVAPSGARAASAGVMLVLAADVAAMAPGTNIGAASPVNIGGKDIGKTMARKVEKDMTAYVRSLAEKRGRNPEWAASAVTKSESISAEKALELKVIDLIAKDLSELLEKIDGRAVTTGIQEKVVKTKGAAVEHMPEGWRYRILRTISDPNIAYLLMMLGMMGIFFELANPGVIFPGVIGAIALILSFFALQTLPVNYAGILLIILAIIFFIAELKITSHGLLGIGGVVSLILGSILLFRTDEAQIGVAWTVMIPAVLTVSAFFLVVGSLAMKAFRLKPVTGDRGIIGEFGRVQDPIRPSQPGKVFVHGEIWNACSEETLDGGEIVEVTGIDHLLLKVKRKTG
ncbi:MAG: nodulation protein NfeD [Deltaproteobacteria bacterium]|nr:nodulation protein NfeD [Deltaproteobacteria bacterium]